MQIAAKFSKALGCEVMHVKLSGEERLQGYLEIGLSEFYAKFLTWLEVGCANGSEERLDDAVEQVTGRPPQKFDSWVEENKLTWQ